MTSSVPLGLVEAASAGDKSTVFDLLQKNVPVDQQDEDGASALHYAAGGNYVRIAQILVDAGCSVSIVDNTGSTPLHWAARSGADGVARVLLQNSANPFAKDCQGSTCLNIAVTHKQKDVVDLLKTAAVDDIFDDMEDAFSAAQSPTTWKDGGGAPSKAQPQSPVSVPIMIPGPRGQPYIMPPNDAPGKVITTVSQPSKETSTSLVFELSGVHKNGLELYPSSVLRCALPAWAVGRLIRHVFIRHRSVAAGNADSSAYGAYNRVRAWGCSLASQSFPGSVEKVTVGATVLLYGLAAKEFNGTVAKVTRVGQDGSKLEVSVKRGKEKARFSIKSTNVRVIREQAQWWDYENTKDGYNPKQGVFAPLRPESDPVLTSFCDWNCHVGMLYTGCIDIEGVGKNSTCFSIVHDVKIDFFPANYVVVNTDMKIVVDARDYLPARSLPKKQSFQESEGGGATLLHWAAWKNDTEAAEALLEMGAESSDQEPPENRVTEGGSTPLHWAAKQDSIDVAELLLMYGASPMIKNKMGETALSIAETKGSVDMIALFRSASRATAAKLPDDDDMLLAQFMGGGLDAESFGGDGEGVTSNPDAEKETMIEDPQDTTVALETPHQITARHCIIKKKPGEKIGFRLHSPKDQQGTRIVGISPEGPADRAGNLRDGDLILSVQGKPVLQRSHDDVIQEIKAAGNEVHLVVIEPDRMQTEIANMYRSQQAGTSKGPSSLSAKSSATQLRRLQTKRAAAVFPHGSQAPIEVFRDPEYQSSTSVKFQTGGVVLGRGEHLRFELPFWCTARVLKSITVSQKKNVADRNAISCYQNTILYDTAPVSTRATVWGTSLEEVSKSKPFAQDFVGKLVVLCGYHDSDQCGLLGTVSSCSKTSELSVKLLESRETVRTRMSNVRLVSSPAKWWEYNDSYHYDPAVGLQAGIAQSGIPAQVVYGDWNIHVAALLVGVIDLSAVGDGSAIITSVEVEFFPQHVPASAGYGETLIVVQEQFVQEKIFCPVQEGVSGIQSALDEKIHSKNLVKLGSGWIHSGTKYSPPEAWNPAEAGLGHIDENGTLCIPLLKGQHVLGFEVAIRHWADPERAKRSEFDDHGNINSSCRIWASFPRSDGVNSVDFASVPRRGIVSGGPIGHDFVALEGDELKIGTFCSPARLLGYRVIHKKADPQLEEINALRQNEFESQDRTNRLADQRSGEFAKMNLSLDVPSIRIDTSNSEYFCIGSLGPYFVGSHRHQKCLVHLVNRLDLIASDEIYQEAFAHDMAKLCLYTNHANILRLFGLHVSHDPFELDEFRINVCAIYEYAPCGTFRGLIDAQPIVAPHDHIDILEGIASGMEYLHTRKPAPIIHGDLRASSVLLKSGRTPCIADFGISKWKVLHLERRNGAAYSSGTPSGPISPAYASPEQWETGLESSQFSDVYSFGTLLYEATTGSIPWADVPENEIGGRVCNGERPTDTFKVPHRTLFMLMWRCWEHHDVGRPESFLHISNLLHEIRLAKDACMGDSIASTAARFPQLLPPVLDEPDLPWSTKSLDGSAICILDKPNSSEMDGLLLTLRQQLISLCSESSLQNEGMSKSFDIAAVSVKRDASHPAKLANQVISLSSTDEKSGWQGERTSLGHRSFASTKRINAWRKAALDRLQNKDLYRVLSGGAPGGKVKASIATVFYPVPSQQEAIQHLSTGMHVGRSGDYGKGLHAFLDIHHAMECSAYEDEPVTLIVAHAVFRKTFPITGKEKPGEPDSLVGKDIVTDHDSHLVLSLRGESSPLAPAFWHFAQPSAMMVFREKCTVGLCFPFCCDDDEEEARLVNQFLRGCAQSS